MTERDKAIIEKILSIEKEQRRRYDNDELSRYNARKVHLKQMEFHRCPKRNRWVFGGNRTGKTECGAVEVVWLARGNHPYKQNKPTCGWVVSLSKKVQREVAQRKILKYLNPDWIVGVVMDSGSKANLESGVIDCLYIRNVFGSVSSICFKSCEMGREAFCGASLDYVWFDEEPPEDIYTECAMRVVDKKGLIFGTMTPLLGKTFVYDKIYLNTLQDPEVWHIFIEWADNPYLDKTEIERVSKTLSGKELDARRYGKFTDAAGLVYPEFDESVNVITPFEFPPEWQDCISIDPGLTNPLSCHWYCVDYDGNVYVVAEHFAAGRTAKEHCDEIIKISNALGWKKNFGGKIYGLIDSAAGQRTLNGEKSVAELFDDYGISVSTDVNKDLYSGINRVKQYLSGTAVGGGKRYGSCNSLSGACGRLYIFSSCVNLIAELKTYRWGKDDRPLKKDDHCLDELRYYLMSRPQPPRLAAAEKNEIATYKEKLIKRNRRKTFN